MAAPPAASEEDEEIFVAEGGSADDTAYDDIVGSLQELLLDDSFVSVQRGYCEEHCHHFEDSDENKLVYTELFTNYTNLLESVIEKRLSEEHDGFSMGGFQAMLASQPEEDLCGDVFDMLLSLADFGEFKELMLVYRRQQSADSPPALTDLLVTGPSRGEVDGAAAELAPGMQQMILGPDSPEPAPRRRDESKYCDTP